jgi:vacuolar protein sorting-associated protein 1
MGFYKLYGDLENLNAT